MTDQTWWDVFVSSGGLPDLETWLGGVDAASRVRIRERIAECHYESVLDCGAGLGTDAIGMGNLSHECAYTGVEPSAAMRGAALKVAEAYERDPFNIVEGDITALPFPDASFDLVYCRHVLEHLPSFETALSEMVRVARLETIAVFFMRPGAETYLFRERDGLWQNRYAKADVETLLASLPRVAVFFWETLGSEALLHAYLTDAVAVDPDKVRERLTS